MPVPRPRAAGERCRAKRGGEGEIIRCRPHLLARTGKNEPQVRGNRIVAQSPVECGKDGFANARRILAAHRRSRIAMTENPSPRMNSSRRRRRHFRRADCRPIRRPASGSGMRSRRNMALSASAERICSRRAFSPSVHSTGWLPPCCRRDEVDERARCLQASAGLVDRPPPLRLGLRPSHLAPALRGRGTLILNAVTLKTSECPGTAACPPETCMRPSSAQRRSCGNTFPGLSRWFGSKAHLTRICWSRSVCVEHFRHQVALFDADAVLAGEHAAHLHAQAQNVRAEILGLAPVRPACWRRRGSAGADCRRRHGRHWRRAGRIVSDRSRMPASTRGSSLRGMVPSMQ